MRDEPKVILNVPDYTLIIDTTKSVVVLRHQDSGHGSRNLLRSV
jgi:phage anti-repressor protein